MIYPSSYRDAMIIINIVYKNIDTDEIDAIDILKYNHLIDGYVTIIFE